MITKELVDESLNIHRLVDCGDFDLAYQQSVVFLGKLEKIKVKGDNYFIVLGNVATEKYLFSKLLAVRR